MKRQAHDLGQLTAGQVVRVTISGTEINLVLLDPLNKSQYLKFKPYNYFGGHFKGSPAQIVVPRDGHWYLGVDFGGGRGAANYRVSVLPAKPR